MSFATVAVFGAKLAKAMILGANTVEGIQGAVKGSAKRDLALSIATEALGFCKENQNLPMTPKIKEKLDKYNDAYVELQNAIAEASGVK